MKSKVSLPSFYNAYSDPQIAERWKRLAKTINRLDEFSGRGPGWDLGRGNAIRDDAIDQTKALLGTAFKLGLWQSNVFASPSGSVLLTFTIGDHDIEVGVEGDDTYSLVYEVSDQPCIDIEAVDIQTIETILANLANKICSSERLISTTMTPTKGDSEAQHLSRPMMVGSQYSVKNVPKREPGLYANILQGSILISPDLHPYSGHSQPRTYLREVLAA